MPISESLSWVFNRFFKARSSSILEKVGLICKALLLFFLKTWHIFFLISFFVGTIIINYLSFKGGFPPGKMKSRENYFTTKLHLIFTWITLARLLKTKLTFLLSKIRLLFLKMWNQSENENEPIIKFVTFCSTFIPLIEIEGQVYSNTRVSMQVDMSQHEPTQIKTCLTWVRHDSTRVQNRCRSDSSQNLRPIKPWSITF